MWWDRLKRLKFRQYSLSPCRYFKRGTSPIRNRYVSHSTVAFGISPSRIRPKAEGVLHFTLSSVTILFVTKASGM